MNNVIGKILVGAGGLSVRQWEIYQMEYEEFLANYNSRQIKVNVNKYDAKRLLSTNILPKRYVVVDIIWSWIWLLALPTGISVMIWGNFWIGAIICFLFFFIHEAQRRSAAKYVLEFAQENKDFYNFAIDKNIIHIVNVEIDHENKKE